VADPAPDGGWLPAQIEAELPTFVPEVKTLPWRYDIQDHALRWAFRVEGTDKPPATLERHKDNLPKLRADLKRTLGQRLDAAGRPAWKPLLVHEARKAGGMTRHRLALPAACIEFAGRA
jgi:hypothetical protein